MVPNRKYLILGGALTNDVTVADIVDWLIGSAWWRHGALLTGDDHGICAEVARRARLTEPEGIPCQIVGLGKRPSNGAPGNYTRLVVDSALPRTERLRLRDQYAVQLADYVITVGDHPAHKYAQACSKRFVYSL